MSIVEKLGIEKFDIPKNKPIMINSDILLEVEQQRNDLLEALIDDWKHIEHFLGGHADEISSNDYYSFTERQHYIELAIQKADPQHRKWEDIKELL